MPERNLKHLSDEELRKQMKKYRFITLTPLLLGLLAISLLIWFDRERNFGHLLYFLLILVMMPLILKSGSLHREWRRRRSNGF
ncbi:MAG: hypothetical protein D6813_14950 [Calditrichaeota bacterium]|nr:MAG: hypothetical protein D6813_14950 [Calditrichota bacterium]